MKPNFTIPIHARWFSKSVRRRALFVFGLALGTLLITVGVIVGSMWIETRFPSDDANRVLLPGVQRAVTKPIVNALGRQVERSLRSRTEDRYINNGLTLEETIVRLLDDRVSLVKRGAYAFRLAKDGSPKCIAALLKALQTAPPDQKAYLAHLIGSAGNPAAKGLLLPLLDDANESVAIAAIRGLSVIGSADISARIEEILADSQREDRLRVEAALGLGSIGTPEARDALVGAFTQDPEEEVATQILKSLGRFDFPTVADTFKEYLAAPETPAEMRVVAAEALANSSREAVPFLLGLAGNDGDADVRAAAAWSISVHDTVTELGPTLTTMAERETDADVRRRLYEALLPQAGIPGERLLPVVRAENDVEARVAGFNALGLAANRQPSSPVATAFDKEIVPELMRIATAPNSLNIQMRAVFALRRAQTTAAKSALTTIARNARPEVAAAARNGLKATNS